jgi:hypothetical protein
MNILEDYAHRNGLKCCISHHSDSSFLVLRADRKRWETSCCVLSANWQPNSYHPGSYKICLRSPSHYPKSQDVFSLNKFHWMKEVSWSDYESFFHEWKPCSNGLYPIFDEEAILSIWEIFIFIHEYWFVSQPSDFKRRLYETISNEIEVNKRMMAFEQLTLSEPFVSSCVNTFWIDGFYAPFRKSYLNWFKSFT